jgi:hypothetical protein
MIQSPSGIAMSAITISGRQSAMTFIASVTPPPGVGSDEERLSIFRRVRDEIRE